MGDTPPTIRYARTKDGVNIAYCYVGSGPAAVMLSAVPVNNFIAGWDGPISGVKGIASVLQQRGRSFVTFDMRGLGSSSEAEDFSLDAFASDIEAVVDALQLQTFDLWAVMNATPVAVAYAASHPERVSRLALEMPFLRGEESLNTEAGRAARSLRGQDWDLYTEASMYVMRNLDSEFAGESARLMRSVASPEMYRRAIEAVDAFDISDCVAAVQCPTLVTFRTDITVTPIEESRRVAAGIPGAQFKVVANFQEAVVGAGISLAFWSNRKFRRSSRQSSSPHPTARRSSCSPTSSIRQA